MNLISLNSWAAVGAMVLTATAVFGDAANRPATAAAAKPADQAGMAPRPEKSCSGTVLSVDPKERVFCMKERAFSRKTFNVGDNCVYALQFTVVANNDGMAIDLRPGEKVNVSYQDWNGVLIADRIEQQPVWVEGTVAAIDPGQHVLILRRRGFDRKMTIGADCFVLLRGQKLGSLAELHPGNRVKVAYETPGGKPTAREIAQTSRVFTGTLMTIDLGGKTVKAKALYESKKFSVADNCAIGINGRLDGKLGDLKPDDKLVFSYDEINGVNVVNRIGAVPAKVQHEEKLMTRGY